jgi:hypothetical protein
MQIEKPGFLTPKISNHNHPVEHPSSEGDFRAILDGSIPPSDKTNSFSSNPLRSNFSPPIEITPLSVIGKTNYIGKIEQFLTALDTYQQKLSDTEWTLKDLAPVISDMSSQKEMITEIYESLPDDEGLKQILNQALIISSVEIAKFNRGDYLPSE